MQDSSDRQAAPAVATITGQRHAVDLAESDVYGSIKALIVTGAIRPGEPISQLDLARRLGVSRTPVREALRRLQAESLVEGQRNQRMRVPAVTVDEMDAIYATRIFVECTAVALTVPRMTDADLDELQRASQAVSWTLSDRYTRELDQQLLRFKLMAMKHAGAGLRAAVADYWDKCERFRWMYSAVTPGSLAVGEDEHKALLRAYLTRATDEAVFIASRHLGRTAIAAQAYMDPDYEPRAVRFALAQISRPTAPLASPLLNVIGEGPVAAPRGGPKLSSSGRK